MERLQELVRLHRMGTGAREVAQLVQMSPNTERQYRLALMAAGLLEGAVDALPELDVLMRAALTHLPNRTGPQQVSSLQPWLDIIVGLHGKGLGPRGIYDRLQLENEEFRSSKGTLSAVKRVCVRLRKAQGVREEAVALPVETRAGEVAQVDFGSVGRLTQWPE